MEADWLFQFAGRGLGKLDLVAPTYVSIAATGACTTGPGPGGSKTYGQGVTSGNESQGLKPCSRYRLSPAIPS
jgi:hypothetical protein